MDNHNLFMWDDKTIFRYPFVSENKTISEIHLSHLNELDISFGENQNLIYRQVQPTTNPNATLVNILIEVSDQRNMAIIYDYI